MDCSSSRPMFVWAPMEVALILSEATVTTIVSQGGGLERCARLFDEAWRSVTGDATTKTSRRLREIRIQGQNMDDCLLGCQRHSSTSGASPLPLAERTVARRRAISASGPAERE